MLAIENGPQGIFSDDGKERRRFAFPTRSVWRENNYRRLVDLLMRGYSGAVSSSGPNSVCRESGPVEDEVA
jgi:hypothetical protein